LLDQKTDRLSVAQRIVLAKADNQFLLSEASLYEIEIKIRVGEDKDFQHITIDGVERFRRQLRIKLLRCRIAHHAMIPNVPKVFDQKGNRHGDPFDLLILAQAQFEQLPVLSTDRYSPSYRTIETIF